MLILERRAGESLAIGDEIRLTVLSVGEGGKVQLGISAPRDVLILRSELQQARTVNQDAAVPGDGGGPGGGAAGRSGRRSPAVRRCVGHGGDAIERKG